MEGYEIIINKINNSIERCRADWIVSTTSIQSTLHIVPSVMPSQHFSFSFSIQNYEVESRFDFSIIRTVFLVIVRDQLSTYALPRCQHWDKNMMGGQYRASKEEMED